jgi:RNA polymerase sigma-70 factor (ECF subfamily)
VVSKTPRGLAVLAKQNNVVELHPLAAVSDAELVEKLQEGQFDAQREVVRRYGTLVSGLTANILGLHDDVADLSQEALLIVFRDIGKIRDPGALRAWIISIAVSRARNALRSRRRRWWLSFWNPSDLPEVTTEPRHDEAVIAVYDALGKMENDERSAFALRYVAGMTVLEVGEAMGFSHSTAKRTLARARASFDRLTHEDPRLTDWNGSEGVHE